MSEQEAKGSHDVSLIMDDMQSYFERRQFLRFKTVLDEMRQQDVIGGLRQLGDDIKKENGVSIAQCEFWSDTLDRWAEDLVDPACSGTCPGGKSTSSLPPSIVLEVLQILEAEVNLREETRVAEQARPAIKAEEHKKQAGKLSETQKGIQDRTDKVTQKIRELPDGEREFGKEIALLSQVSAVMGEAADDPGEAGDRQGRPSAPRPRPSNCSSSPSGSTPRPAAAAVRAPAAAAPARPTTRPSPSSAAASTRRKSARTAASRRPPANRARPCPRSSEPAWMNTSTGSRKGPAASNLPVSLSAELL